MKWLSKYKIFLESKKEIKYSNKKLINEICVSMVLLNNEFLDNILDRGLKARYSENSKTFLTDLKNLVMSKNRLKLGFHYNEQVMEDKEISKINDIFNNLEFNIEDDWNLLVNARITARNIIDKLLPNDKLRSEMIKTIYWLGPNKDKDNDEDIVIETNDGKQYSFYLDKNLSNSKTSSVNKFLEELLDEEDVELYGDKYIKKWDKLTQQWVSIIYENVNKDIQRHIEKFIDPRRIESLTYFDYFDIKHRDPKYKHLGEKIPQFDKNILKLKDLLKEIWNNRDKCFMDVESVYNRWMEVKIIILNSKILENLLTSSMKMKFGDNITKLENGYKKAEGDIKMKFFKLLVDKLGCKERNVYYLSNKGNIFNLVPSRQFFRDHYDNLEINFDYHVNFFIDEEEDENNNFNIRVNLLMDNKSLLSFLSTIKFTSGELSSKLTTKHKFELDESFNFEISKKINK
jgi:hypothetical protein